jgi:signal-transduction protein with cAMP-binding, CBS, and nucleotidyltransferase domain
MPVGFNFFGNLKLEKTGSHRGEFNLQQLAISPLVATIRMLAIRSGISASSTPERIKSLVDTGELGVDQATKLLQGYHNFLRLKIFAEISGKLADKDGFFINHEDMVEDEEEKLIQGLDALFNLQRILFQSVEA